MGFTKDEVEWTVVPFNNSFKPGPKDFDFDINQISYTPKRAEAVDFSDSYYDVNQSVVALKDSKIANATSLADLKDAKLGAPVGTTSYDYITENIQPSQQPQVYDTPRRRRGRAEGEADRRPRRRPADRLLHHGSPGPERKIVGSSPPSAPRSTSGWCSRRTARSPSA
jgi:polar amino acid transport system substrate-binding protein